LIILIDLIVWNNFWQGWLKRGIGGSCKHAQHFFLLRICMGT